MYQSIAAIYIVGILLSSQLAPSIFVNNAYAFGSNLFTLSIILTIKRIARMISESPAGFIASVYGERISFIISVCMMFLSSVSYYYFQGLYGLCFAITLTGFAQSFYATKITTSIYNVCERHNMIHKFQTTLVIFYFLGDIMHACTSILAMKIYKNYGYTPILIINTIQMFSAGSYLILGNKDVVNFGRNISKTPRKISFFIKDIKKFFRAQDSKHIFAIACLWSGANYFLFQIPLIMAMIMIDMKYDSTIVYYARPISHIAYAAGVLLALFLTKNRTIKDASLLLLLIIINMLISLILYNKYTMVALMIAALISCSIVIIIIKYVESNLSRDNRSLVTSMVETISLILNITLTISIGAISAVIGYNKAISIIIFIITIMVSISYYYFAYIDIKKKPSIHEHDDTTSARHLI